MVVQTWKGTLENEEDLPKNWTEVGGVLVGTIGVGLGNRESLWVSPSPLAEID
jgi:hypothetical protein